MTRLYRRLTISPRRILEPGTALMLRLPMRAKLLTVALCVAAPVVALVGGWLWSAQARLGTLTEMSTGIALIDRTTLLAFELHKHRLLAHRLASGDAAARNALAEAMRAVQLAVRSADDAVARAPQLTLEADWRGVTARVHPLGEGEVGAQPSAQTYDEVLDALAVVQRLAAERSGVLPDPEPAGATHVEVALLSLPGAMDSVARSGVVGLPLLARRDTPVSVPERGEVLALARQIDHDMQQLSMALASLERQGAARAPSHAAATQAADAHVALLRDTFSREQPETPPQVLATAAWTAVTRLHDLHRDTMAAMSAQLEQRTHAVWRTLVATAAGLVVSMLVLAYLFGALYRSFLGSIGSLLHSTEAVAAGDLTTELELAGRDELAEMGRTVNGMSRTLSELVGAIRSSAARVNMAGTQVAEGSQRLSQRTEEQASSLRESVESINQLSTDVQHTAQEARELDGLTEQLTVRAGDGHQAMGETITAVGRLQEASRRVFEVVAVIDDVAFQTGMLSLNASVEAARAGEAGKGFAIVAGEVRQLAQRVGESADEIRTLITQASDELEFSSHKLGSADQALQALVEGVRDVSERLRRISQASTSQSETLVGVAHRVGDLDQITRDNARLVDESTAASQSLLERARILRETVASMRLRQGTADEAHELLDRAFDHVVQVGLEQGLADLHDPAHGFIDRDLYVFALDRDGVYIACGAKPELIGKAVDTLPGIKGTSFVRDAWAAAEAGGGWVQYEIANPLTGEVAPKESYLRQYDQGVLLGCGVYRRADMAEVAAKPRAAAWSRTLESPAHDQV